jgi:hypothetical protein
MIDPVRLAQFMLLPGASELVEAFASLPPGEVRDSAVAHVQVLARASGWTAPHPFGERVQQARVVRSDPPRLTSAVGEKLSATSLEGKIVERALRGESVDAIVWNTEASPDYVERVLRKARRVGGIVFPGDDAKPATKAKKKPPASRKPAKFAPAPAPKPPYWWEDPASPIWDNPSLLPSMAEREASLSGVGPTDTRGFATMTKAAKEHGLTLRQYIARRLDIIARTERGEAPVAISHALKLRTPSEVYGLLARVGRNRLRVMLEAAAAEPELAKPEPAPPTIDPRGLSNKVDAARRWGFESLEDYEACRARVRELRLRGVAPAHIAHLVGQPWKFVRNTLDTYRLAGQQWPPVDIVAHEREAVA